MIDPQVLARVFTTLPDLDEVPKAEDGVPRAECRACRAAVGALMENTLAVRS